MSTAYFNFNETKNDIILMTHNWELHAALSEFDPGQTAPPLEGSGLLQTLV